MSIPVTVGTSSYNVPVDGERGWGQDVTNLLEALANASYLILGGSIPLTSEADFGAVAGLKALYYKSRTANTASAGIIRLANTDAVKWRNGANSADLSLAISSDRLQYESNNVVTAASTDALTNKTLDAALNTLSNIDTTMLASGVLITSTSLTGASNLNFPSTLAIKTYVDNSVAAHDNASEITYTPTTGTDWPDPDPATVQEGLDHLASERVLNTTFTAHTGASSGVHGVTGSVVGTSDSQTLTNKNLASSTNTLTGATAASFDNSGATITLPSTTSTVATLALSETFTNKTLTSPVINTSVSGTALETDLSVSAASNKIPTAAAAKAYADGLVGSSGTYVNKVADYTITTSDGYRVVAVTTSTTDRTITLPAAASSTNRIITIKKDDSASGKVIVDGSGSETIDGALTQILAFEDDSITIICTGSAWESTDKHRVSDGSYVAPVGAIGQTLTNSGTQSGASSGVLYGPASVSLTKGVWAISGSVVFLTTGGNNLQNLLAAYNTTSASLSGNSAGLDFIRMQYRDTSGNDIAVTSNIGFCLPTYFVSVTSTTTYYLNAAADFTGGGTADIKGVLNAIRIF